MVEFFFYAGRRLWRDYLPSLLVVTRVNFRVRFLFLFSFFFFHVAISDSVQWLPYLGFVPGPTRTTSKGLMSLLLNLTWNFSAGQTFILNILKNTKDLIQKIDKKGKIFASEIYGLLNGSPYRSPVHILSIISNFWIKSLIFNLLLPLHTLRQPGQYSSL